jgi:diadenosine tetraphosphate (Ap4A) HIT family hydrolase
MHDSCEYCQIKDGYGDLIYDSDYWMIFLAPSQRYLGTCVVALKRKCADLSELNEEEWIDFAHVVQNLESTWKKIFNPTVFNWSCYKNSTFRYSNPDPEIHWHFLPRYKDDINFLGMNFKDPDFGFIPKPITHKLPSEIQKKLLKEIKSNI